jgi:predicted RNase H-like HicB family nuclease
MPDTLYPAVLERADKKAFAVWFPDFPDCVAVGHNEDEAVEKARDAVAAAVEMLAERDTPLPLASPIRAIVRPKNFLAFVMVSVAPPDPSERVNVYLPKRLIARADDRAAELGMSRSSYFGFALSIALGSSFTGVGVPQAIARLARARGVTESKTAKTKR